MTESQPNATERMRSVLQAMERGIDAARERRTSKPQGTASGPGQPSAPAAASAFNDPSTAGGSSAPMPASQKPSLSQAALGAAPGKLKAKPKRSPSFMDAAPPAYRSQAG